MGNVRTYQRSFAGGEVSPEMFGRNDDAKYQTGLAKCRNFIPKPQGPAHNRPGLAFVRAVKDSSKRTRLIPFTYSTSQTMVLETGAGYFRFHTQGATLMGGNSEKVTNGDFTTNITGWTDASQAPSAILWNSGNAGQLRLQANSGLSSIARQTISLLPGTIYTVTVVSAGRSGTSPNNANAYLRIGTTQGGYDIINMSGLRTAGTYTATFTATTSTAYISLIGDYDVSGTLTYDIPSISVVGPDDMTRPFEITNPYAEADLFDLHFVQSSDVLTLVHPNYAPRELRRLGPTHWTLSTILFSQSIAAPSSVTGISQGFTTAKYSYQYVVTAVGADGVGESAASVNATGATKAITGATKANPGVLTVTAHGLTVGDSFSISGVVGMGELNGNTYTVNTAPSANSLTLKDAAGNVVDTTAFGTYTSGGTLTPNCIRGNLFESGCTNVISWSAVPGAFRYNVYKQQGGLYGYIGQTTGLSIVDDNIAPDLGKTPPTYDSVFNATGDYPAAVSYFEQRRTFAGTTSKPQNIWMTKSGTESDMSYSLPIKDDDRIAFRVASREANTIRHIVPLTQLLLLTSGAEWRVTSVNSDAITPSTISVRPQSYVGASNVQPVTINNTCLYGAARGGHVRELAYNWQANGFITGDLSLRAPHLFDTFDIVDMAYAKAPIPLVWFVSSSGVLLGLTYVPEQQIGAWHWHDTDGVFESCTVVPEGSEDVLYCIVRRTINGASVRYVERMASRQFIDQEDAFFVDAGATYSGVAADVISGLAHLEGKTVNILADGVVHPQRVVTGGSVTLNAEASKVQIGLPITADLETLPVALQLQDGSFAQGHVKNVNKAWLRVHRSAGVFVGPDANSLTEAKQSATPSLNSDEIMLMLSPSWGSSGQVFVRQSDPLPLTVVSLTLEVALGG